jgi:gliding motility-associated-like protein
VGYNTTNLYLTLGDDTAVCSPYYLSVTVPGASFLWEDNTTSDVDVATSTGIYYVTAYENGCFNSDTVGVYFVDLSQALQDTVICKDHPIELTLHANVPPQAQAIWSTGNTQDSITISEPGKYWVTVTEAACIGSDSMTLGEAICACTAAMPEAFTPNNDGHNDYYFPIIEHGCLVRDYTFCVYNRWGEMVFSTHDPLDKWDGKYFGIPQDLGTYMYFVEYMVDGSSHKFLVKGDFILIR